MKNILLLEDIHPAALATLERSGHRILTAPAPDRGEEIATGQDVHAIVTRGRGRVDAALIAACPALRVVARCGVGLDNVDLAAASRRRIPVLNTPGANADTVAEHTLLLLLALRRQLFPMVKAVKAGHWERRTAYAGNELRGQTLGIVGLGNIGGRVKRLAEAFGMHVIHHARSGGSHGLNALLGAADVISLHLPLGPETEHLIGAEALACCRPDALLINTSRAGLVDQNALLEQLVAGQLGGYAADLLDEPATQGQLLALDNVLITPHVASLTATTYAGMCQTSVDNVLATLGGQTPDARYIANHPQS